MKYVKTHTQTHLSFNSDRGQVRAVGHNRIRTTVQHKTYGSRIGVVQYTTCHRSSGYGTPSGTLDFQLLVWVPLKLWVACDVSPVLRYLHPQVPCYSCYPGYIRIFSRVSARVLWNREISAVDVPRTLQYCEFVSFQLQYLIPEVTPFLTHRCSVPLTAQTVSNETVLKAAENLAPGMFVSE